MALLAERVVFEDNGCGLHNSGDSRGKNPGAPRRRLLHLRGLNDVSGVWTDLQETPLLYHFVPFLRRMILVYYQSTL